MSNLGLETILVIFVVGVISFALAWKQPFTLLLALVVLVPFRDFLIRWMNASTDLSPDWVNAISRSWFIIILALLAAVSLQWVLDRFRHRRPVGVDAIDITLGLVLLIGVVHTLITPNFSAGFASLRGYMQPLGVFVLARVLRPTPRQLRVLLLLLVIVGLVMTAFEFWQVTSWTADDYQARGYLRQNGELVTPTIEVRGQDYIRPTSTVSGPNELGVDLMLLMFIALYAAFETRAPWRFASITAAVIFTLGNLLTFSRSALLGMVAASIVLAILVVRRAVEDGRVGRANPSKRVILAFIAGAVLLGMALSYSGVFGHLERTVRDLTSEYHFVDSREALAYLLKNPGGVGMGLVEPKGALVLIESAASYHVEGSLFQIAMEMGLWGLGLWGLFWAACLLRIWRLWLRPQSAERKILQGAALSGWTGALVAFVFLPLMQSISLMVWLWFLLGTAIQAGDA